MKKGVNAGDEYIGVRRSEIVVYLNLFITRAFGYGGFCTFSFGVL